jgi:hypothetical protein
MPDTISSNPQQEESLSRDATCIHTKKIYDSCQSKDCLEDLRLYPTATSAEIIERAVSIKAGSANLLCVELNVQPVGFHRGYFSIDLRYFYKITADAFCGGPRPMPVCGLAVFDKRSILFGSEGGAKVFSSAPEQRRLENEDLSGCDLPTAVLEAVDPVMLSVRLTENCEMRPCDCAVTEIPNAVRQAFCEDLTLGCPNSRRVYVTLGQFSILRLERDTQLLMPIYDYCIPEKECDCANCEETPCELFSQVDFPVDQFFPPASAKDIDPMRLFRTNEG